MASDGQQARVQTAAIHGPFPVCTWVPSCPAASMHVCLCACSLKWSLVSLKFCYFDCRVVKIAWISTEVQFKVCV